MPPVIKTPLLFYCCGCWDKKGKKSKKFKEYKSGSKECNILKYVSYGLRKHLNYNIQCYNLYKSEGLIKQKISNFSTSVKVQPTLPSVQHSPSDFGMTMTQNGPSVPPSHLSHDTVTSQSAKGLHSGVLNQQIVHEVFLPPMDRNAIESYMAVSAVQDEDTFPLNNDIDNADDKDDNVDDEAFQSHTKLPPPHHLLAELELMNLMARHKLPLNTFKSIFQWAKKSQMRPGFDFCDAKIRSRKAIFDNLQSNLGLSDMKFHPHILNWLPDNKPTQQLMREENLSFPDYSTPLSPDNNPEQLTLTPLNMTLAWTTIYFHPNPKWESTRYSRPATSKEKIQNLHNGLEVVFRSFEAVYNKDGGIEWNYLPYANQQWKVKMKFAIAYVIGDTELHDKLCGKYGSFNKGIIRMCRHYNCYSPNINIPSVQPATKKWSPVNFHCFPGTDLNDINKNFKNNSHHNIRNVFHDLCFGTNQNNIHFATPSECLHMHQLGTAKRAVKSIELLLHGSVPCVYAPNLKHGVAVANSIGHLAQWYGGLLSRQSDRDFPCTKFGTQLLSTTKKEGHDYSGMLISLLIAMVSKHGSDIIDDHRFVKKQIEVIQLILSMEEFLKHGRMKNASLKNLPKTIVHFINCINSTCHRKGMGTKLIKNHLYFHLTDYISLWGSLAGWDSAPNESHHKSEIKAPSKNTEGNAASLIGQTANQKSEKMMLSQATYHYNLNPPDPPPIERPDGGGSHFQIMRTENGESTMKWLPSTNKTKPFFPSDTLDFVCDSVLPLLENPLHICGVAEHNRYDVGCGPNFIFCLHPSYRSNSSLLNSVRMDWCLMKLDFDLNNNPKLIPCHLLCLLTLAVVPEEGKDGCITNCDWLVISNRISWLDFFECKNAATPLSYKCLYKACTLQDDIQLEPFEMALNDNKSSDYVSSSESDSSDSSSN
eukprot:jgi/Psemu1/10407/gm1.10407_g